MILLLFQARLTLWVCTCALLLSGGGLPQPPTAHGLPLKFTRLLWFPLKAKLAIMAKLNAAFLAGLAAGYHRNRTNVSSPFLNASLSISANSALSNNSVIHSVSTPTTPENDFTSLGAASTISSTNLMTNSLTNSHTNSSTISSLSASNILPAPAAPNLFPLNIHASITANKGYPNYSSASSATLQSAVGTAEVTPTAVTENGIFSGTLSVSNVGQPTAGTGVSVGSVSDSAQPSTISSVSTAAQPSAISGVSSGGVAGSSIVTDTLIVSMAAQPSALSSVSTGAASGGDQLASLTSYLPPDRSTVH